MTKIIKARKKLTRQYECNLLGNNYSTYTKKNYKPGERYAQSNVRTKKSKYGEQLIAKQRVRMSHNIREKQFRNIFSEALRRKGDTGKNFLSLLASRLDSVVLHMNLAPTIRTAQQLISHGHVKVNGKRVTIKSYLLKVGDIITIKEQSHNLSIVSESISKGSFTLPSYIETEKNGLVGKLVAEPQLETIPYTFQVQPSLIVEFYSRRISK